MPDGIALRAMQAAWDLVYLNRTNQPDLEHTILTNQAVFYVVCPPTPLIFDDVPTLTSTIAQTNQRVYEWRGAFGSTAISVLNSFFDSVQGYETDEDRVEFATNQLTNLSFLYLEAEGDDRAVHDHLLSQI
jgi:hypothetical protein